MKICIKKLCKEEMSCNCETDPKIGAAVLLKKHKICVVIGMMDRNLRSRFGADSEGVHWVDQGMTKFIAQRLTTPLIADM